MKNKYILGIFMFGMLIVFIGALLKIKQIRLLEMNVGNILIVKGMLIQILAGVLVIWKILKGKK